MREKSAGQAENGFDQWAIVELFGHQVIAGRVSEQTIGGASFVRVDVPDVENGSIGFTRFYGQGAIYSITPVSEEAARLAVRRYAPRPITIYVPELALSTGTPEPLDDDGYDER
jgi:hypothetical protein